MSRPVSRCAIRGCPVIGYWPEGGYCPMHRDTVTPRRPDLAETWSVDRDT